MPSWLNTTKWYTNTHIAKQTSASWCNVPQTMMNSQRVIQNGDTLSPVRLIRWQGWGDQGRQNNWSHQGDHTDNDNHGWPGWLLTIVTRMTKVTSLTSLTWVTWLTWVTTDQGVRGTRVTNIIFGGLFVIVYIVVYKTYKQQSAQESWPQRLVAPWAKWGRQSKAAERPRETTALWVLVSGPVSIDNVWMCVCVSWRICRLIFLEKPLPCELSCLELCLLIMSGRVYVCLGEYVD